MKNLNSQMRKAIDLFSGCGGLTLGLRDAGFQVIASAEIRSEARETYALNHPETHIYHDIRIMDGSQVLANFGLAKGELDLLAACPPCQGFSSIRTRNQEISNDPRNELIFEVMRLVEELLPKCILIENVPRLLDDSRVETFKSTLAKLGYLFTGGVLDAQHFGVPQRRKRMILIGSRVGEIDLPSAIPSLKKTVKDAIGDIPSPDSAHRRPLHRLRQKFTDKILERISYVKKSRYELPEHLVLECHKKYPNGFRDVYGRISWDEVSPTITRFSHNPSKGRFLHPKEDRGLTAYEAMILQGFPRSYKVPLKFGIGKISSMIGEALPPPFALAQGRHIRRCLDHLEQEADLVKS